MLPLASGRSFLQQNPQIRRQLRRREVIVQQDALAALFVDHVEHGRVRHGASRADGLGVHAVGLPDGREGLAGADQEVPGVLHLVRLRECQGRRGCIALGIGADGDHAHVRGVGSQALHDGVQLLGRQGADIGAVCVEKRQHHGLALELRKRDRPAELVLQVEIGGQLAIKIGPLQARLVGAGSVSGSHAASQAIARAQERDHHHYQQRHRNHGEARSQSPVHAHSPSLAKPLLPTIQHRLRTSKRAGDGP